MGPITEGIRALDNNPANLERVDGRHYEWARTYSLPNGTTEDLVVQQPTGVYDTQCHGLLWLKAFLHLASQTRHPQP